ncbi:hypothetical protein RSAG8_03792, partial [Rhizoctonia solani AG-8 WAC10335]
MELDTISLSPSNRASIRWSIVSIYCSLAKRTNPSSTFSTRKLVIVDNSFCSHSHMTGQHGVHLDSGVPAPCSGAPTLGSVCIRRCDCQPFYFRGQRTGHPISSAGHFVV